MVSIVCNFLALVLHSQNRNNFDKAYTMEELFTAKLMIQSVAENKGDMELIIEYFQKLQEIKYAKERTTFEWLGDIRLAVPHSIIDK